MPGGEGGKDATEGGGGRDLRVDGPAACERAAERAGGVDGERCFYMARSLVLFQAAMILCEQEQEISERK